MVAICFMLVFNAPWLNILCQVVILGTTVYSGIEYFVKNKAVFKA
jgi:CDP-diacylglycerol--glycerol-3-phosphate 3-phosphatidyltransferase